MRRRWLVFLARHLEYTIVSPDLAWWQPATGRTRLYPSTGGRGRGAGWDCGRGSLAGREYIRSSGRAHNHGCDRSGGRGGDRGVRNDPSLGQETNTSPRDPQASSKSRRVRMGIGSIAIGGIGFVLGVVFGADFSVVAEVAAVIVIVAVLGVISAIAAWLLNVEAVPQDLSSAASPPAALEADRRTGTAVGATVAVVAGAVIGIMSSAGGDGATVVTLTVVVSLATAGAISSFTMAASPPYAVAQVCLSMRHRLPRPLMAFLEDAHRRGVLRQAGAVYQFRHIELQHRLANRHTNKQQASSPAA